MMRTKVALVLGMSIGLAGCDVIEDVLARLASLELLGVIPEPGFSDPASPDHGRVRLALGGRDDAGIPIRPIGSDIEVVPDDGSEVEEEDWTEVDGHDQGSFLIVVDGSGSVEAVSSCDGCPTDPQRIRVDAVKQLADELANCGRGEWRMSLLEFGNSWSSPDLGVSTRIVDWTAEVEEVHRGAEQLGSYGGTPLWDAAYDAIGTLGGELEAHWSGEKAGSTLVILSDGADTESSRSVTDVVAKARQEGITIHAVGFGPASDAVEEREAFAIEGLRQLAGETGGFYGYVSTLDELPALARAVAGSACGGYTELYGTFQEPPPSGSAVTGKVRLKSAKKLAVPFRFTAP